MKAKRWLNTLSTPTWKGVQFFLACSFISGCSVPFEGARTLLKQTVSPSSQRQLTSFTQQQSGSFAVMRTVSAASHSRRKSLMSIGSAPTSPSFLTFSARSIPSRVTQRRKYPLLVLEKRNRRLSLLGNNDELLFRHTLREEESGDLSNISEGIFKLVLKEISPLWYAPDSYFIQRGYAVPPVGDHHRYRKGALGTRAFYLSNGVAIHNAPLWTEEVGGVQLKDSLLEELDKAIPVGAEIRIAP